MPRFKNITGKKFGKLTAIRLASSSSKDGHARWHCDCDCGGKSIVNSNNLRTGNTKSCGCMQIKSGKNNSCFKDGRSHMREYYLWFEIRSRCLNKNSKSYKNYGGRGISICSRWESFENFIADMGKRPTPDHSIDRIDNDGDYEPDNCRWATRRQQANNKRSNVNLTMNGETKTIAQWVRKTGFDHSTIRRRIKMGWPVEKILTHPVRKHRKYG